MPQGICGINRHTMECTSPVPMVSGWGLQKQRLVTPFGPYGLMWPRKDFTISNVSRYTLAIILMLNMPKPSTAINHSYYKMCMYLDQFPYFRWVFHRHWCGNDSMQLLQQHPTHMMDIQKKTTFLNSDTWTSIKYCNTSFCLTIINDTNTHTPV